jgi:capsular exopolysaccharide synthesis family protein
MRRVKIENMPELSYAMEEAINRLRINISFLGSGVKKILVVSAAPNEGKSFVSMQVWRQMAQTGAKSVLLDADMRNSTLVNRYQVVAEDGEKLLGTSHYLLGDQNLSDLLLTVDDSGSAMLLNSYNVVNPSLLVEGERFAQMLETLGEQFRYVFVDVPPLDLVSDAEKIGSMCDGAILVVRSGVTSKRLVKNSISQLDRSGCPLLGIVLNRVESSRANYYHRYGRRYYGNKYYSRKYYGKHGTEQKEQVP